MLKQPLILFSIKKSTLVCSLCLNKSSTIFYNFCDNSVFSSYKHIDLMVSRSLSLTLYLTEKKIRVISKLDRLPKEQFFCTLMISRTTTDPKFAQNVFIMETSPLIGTYRGQGLKIFQRAFKKLKALLVKTEYRLVGFILNIPLTSTNRETRYICIIEYFFVLYIIH